MYKLILSIIMATLVINTLAQKSHLIIYSGEGEGFQVELNGVLQYSVKESNVMIEDLSASSYELKLIIESIPVLEKTIHFMNGISEDSYLLKKNRKGNYVLRFQNSVPIDQAPLPPSTRKVFAYKGDTIQANDATVFELQGYTGYYGCPFPLDEKDFKIAKQFIQSKEFADSKIETARQIIHDNCLLTSQICEIIKMFEFESDKLEIAKKAYGSTLDVGNYDKVKEGMQYESSKDELDAYIQNFKR